MAEKSHPLESGTRTWKVVDASDKSKIPKMHEYGLLKFHGQTEILMAPEVYKIVGKKKILEFAEQIFGNWENRIPEIDMYDVGGYETYSTITLPPMRKLGEDGKAFIDDEVKNKIYKFLDLLDNEFNVRENIEADRFN